MPRPNAPWWRSSRRQWYATIRGRKTPLGIHDPNDADGALREMLRRLGVRIDPAASPAPDERPPERRTVAELVPGYEAEVVSQHAAVTRASYASRLRWLVAEFGDRAAGEIPAAEIERKAKGAGWNNNTRRHFLLVVQHFMRWAGRGAGFSLKKPPPEARGDEAVIRPEQFAELLKHARGDFHPYLRFLWLSGCRPGEACNLTVEQVDWLNGTAVLKKHKTAHKGKRRVLFLSDEAVAVLVAQRARWGEGHLFRGRCDRPFDPIAVAGRMRRVQKLSGVPKTAYCFRHSYITRKLEEGKSDSDVAVLVGHSGTAVISRVYSHLTANARRLRGLA